MLESVYFFTLWTFNLTQILSRMSVYEIKKRLRRIEFKNVLASARLYPYKI